MRAPVSPMVALAVVAVALAPLSVAGGPVCTKEQLGPAYPYDDPPTCALQRLFSVCDDDCLALKTQRKQSAPNCSASSGSPTLYEQTAQAVDLCTAFRAETKPKYMPKMSPGLRNCTRDEWNAWNEQYGPTQPATVCTFKVGDCTDACLQSVEKAVLATPACAYLIDGVWQGEHNKHYLVQCLEARGDSVASNSVMNSVMGSDGKLQVADAALLAATVSPGASSGSNSTPAASTNVDSKPPSMSQARSAGAASGLAVAGAIVAAVAVRG